MSWVYWISTLIVSATLLLSGVAYLRSRSMTEGLQEIGIPDFLRLQLGVLQLCGAIVLLAPQVPQPVREWAYAGAGLFFITSMVAHLAHRDPVLLTLVNLLLLGVLALSRWSLGERLV